MAVANRSYNALLTAIRAIGERANAEPKQRWRCLRRTGLYPSRTGEMAATAVAPSTLQRGHQWENLSGLSDEFDLYAKASLVAAV